MMKEEDDHNHDEDLLKQVPKGVDIYFLMEGDDFDDCNWYSFKSSPDYYGRKKKILEPVVPQLESGDIKDPTFATVGSMIFASGGLIVNEEVNNRLYGGGLDEEVDFHIGKLLPPSTNKVFYFDTRHPEEGWKAAPPMKAERYQHMMVADAGKIYVLGGLKLRHPPISTDETYIFAEVYDPSDPSGGWKPLACLSKEYMRSIDLPQKMTGHAVVKDGLFDRKILFHSFYTKSLFYLCTNRQDCGIYDGDFGICHPSSAFFDGVLYFLDCNRMYAYDVSTSSGKYQPVVLRCAGINTLHHYEDVSEALSEGELQSLGNGYMALVWAEAPGMKEFVDVHYSIIKVSKEGNSFMGVIINCSSYYVKRGQVKSFMVGCARDEEDVRSDAEGSKNTARSGKQLRRKRRWDEVGSVTGLWDEGGMKLGYHLHITCIKMMMARDEDGINRDKEIMKLREKLRRYEEDIINIERERRKIREELTRYEQEEDLINKQKGLIMEPRRRTREVDVWGNPLQDIPKLDIYFLMDTTVETWYCIKNSDYCSNESGTKKCLEAAIPQLPEPIVMATFAAMGSVVYASGGWDRSFDKEGSENVGLRKAVTTNKVFYFDTLHPEEGWKAAPAMNVERYQHMMVADAGKMYVLGGLKLRRPPDSTDGERTYVEVYDPSNPRAGWKPLVRVTKKDLINLPQSMAGHAVAVVPDGLFDRNILFHSYHYKSLFYFSANRQVCETYDERFGKYHKSSAFLDGVLYFLGYNRMSAYDVSTFSGKDQPVVFHCVRTNTLPHCKSVDEPLPVGELQSLGNGCLTVVWAGEPKMDGFLDVHCSIIRMSKEGNSFMGVVLSCSTYSVKGRLVSLMVVCAREEEDVSSDAERGKNSERLGKQLRRKRRWDEVGSLTASY